MAGWGDLRSVARRLDGIVDSPAASPRDAAIQSAVGLSNASAIDSINSGLNGVAQVATQPTGWAGLGDLARAMDNAQAQQAPVMEQVALPETLPNSSGLIAQTLDAPRGFISSSMNAQAGLARFAAAAPGALVQMGAQAAAQEMAARPALIREILATGKVNSQAAANAWNDTELVNAIQRGDPQEDIDWIVQSRVAALTAPRAAAAQSLNNSAFAQNMNTRADVVSMLQQAGNEPGGLLAPSQAAVQSQQAMAAGSPIPTTFGGWMRAGGEMAPSVAYPVAAGVVAGPAAALTVAGLQSVGGTMEDRFQGYVRDGMAESEAMAAAANRALEAGIIDVATGRMPLEEFLKIPGARGVMGRALQMSKAAAAESVQEGSATGLKGLTAYARSGDEREVQGLGNRVLGDMAMSILPGASTAIATGAAPRPPARPVATNNASQSPSQSPSQSANVISSPNTSTQTTQVAANTGDANVNADPEADPPAPLTDAEELAALREAIYGFGDTIDQPIREQAAQVGAQVEAQADQIVETNKKVEPSGNAGQLEQPVSDAYKSDELSSDPLQLGGTNGQANQTIGEQVDQPEASMPAQAAPVVPAEETQSDARGTPVLPAEQATRVQSVRPAVDTAESPLGDVGNVDRGASRSVEPARADNANLPVAENARVGDNQNPSVRPSQPNQDERLDSKARPNVDATVARDIAAIERETKSKVTIAPAKGKRQVAVARRMTELGVRTVFLSDPSKSFKGVAGGKKGERVVYLRENLDENEIAPVALHEFGHTMRRENADLHRELVEVAGDARIEEAASRYRERIVSQFGEDSDRVRQFDEDADYREDEAVGQLLEDLASTDKDIADLIVERPGLMAKLKQWVRKMAASIGASKDAAKDFKLRDAIVRIVSEAEKRADSKAVKKTSWAKTIEGARSYARERAAAMPRSQAGDMMVDELEGRMRADNETGGELQGISHFTGSFSKPLKEYPDMKIALQGQPKAVRDMFTFNQNGGMGADLMDAIGAEKMVEIARRKALGAKAANNAEEAMRALAKSDNPDDVIVARIAERADGKRPMPKTFIRPSELAPGDVVTILGEQSVIGEYESGGLVGVGGVLDGLDIAPGMNPIPMDGAIGRAEAPMLQREESGGFDSTLPFSPGSKLPPTIDVDGVQRPTTNSKAQPIASDEKGVRAFWKWFGESKVVDEQGRPLVVYHGTAYNFDAFGKKVQRAGDPVVDNAYFFTSSPQVASMYALHGSETEGNRVLTAYLNITQPLDGRLGKRKNYSFSWRDAAVVVRAAAGNELAQKALGLPLNTKADGVIAKSVGDNPWVGQSTVFRESKPEDKLVRFLSDLGKAQFERYAKTLGIERRFDLPTEYRIKMVAGKIVDFVVRPDNPAHKDNERKPQFDLALELAGKAGVLTREFAEAIAYGQHADNPHDVYVVFNPSQIKSATGNRGTFDPENPDIRFSPGADDYVNARVNSEIPRVQTMAQLNRALNRLWKKPENNFLASDMQQLLQEKRKQAQARRQKALARDKERGALWLRERLLRAVRMNEVDEDAAKLAEWMILQNEDLVADLAISIRTTKNPDSSVAAYYDSAERMVQLFKGKGDELAIAHEMLHHAEGYMPEPIQHAIEVAWLKELKATYDKATPQVKKVLADVARDVLESDGNGFAVFMLAKKAGIVDSSLYHLSNPSEYWAVNASKMMQDRFKNSGVASDIRRWFQKLYAKVRSILGKASNEAVIRGVDALLNKEFSSRTEGERTGRQNSIEPDIGFSPGSKGVGEPAIPAGDSRAARAVGSIMDKAKGAANALRLERVMNKRMEKQAAKDVAAVEQAAALEVARVGQRGVTAAKQARNANAKLDAAKEELKTVGMILRNEVRGRVKNAKEAIAQSARADKAEAKVEANRIAREIRARMYTLAKSLPAEVRGELLKPMRDAKDTRSLLKAWIRADEAMGDYEMKQADRALRKAASRDSLNRMGQSWRDQVSPMIEQAKLMREGLKHMPSVVYSSASPKKLSADAGGNAAPYRPVDTTATNKARAERRSAQDSYTKLVREISGLTLAARIERMILRGKPKLDGEKMARQIESRVRAHKFQRATELIKLGGKVVDTGKMKEQSLFAKAAMWEMSPRTIFVMLDGDETGPAHDIMGQIDDGKKARFVAVEAAMKAANSVVQEHGFKNWEDFADRIAGRAGEANAERVGLRLTDNRGGQKDVSLKTGQALKLYALSKDGDASKRLQAGVRFTLEEGGTQYEWSEALQSQLVDGLGDDIISIYDKLQPIKDVLFPAAQTVGFILTGRLAPKVANQTNITIDPKHRKGDPDGTLPQVGGKASVLEGAGLLKERTNNASPILVTDYVNDWQSSVREMATIAHLGLPLNMAQRALIGGPGAVAITRGLDAKVIDHLHAFLVSTAELDPKPDGIAAKVQALNNAVARSRTTQASTVLMNFGSVFRTMGEVPTSAWAKGFGKDMFTDKGFEEVLQASPVIRERFTQNYATLMTGQVSGVAANAGRDALRPPWVDWAQMAKGIKQTKNSLVAMRGREALGNVRTILDANRTQMWAESIGISHMYRAKLAEAKMLGKPDAKAWAIEQLEKRFANVMGSHDAANLSRIRMGGKTNALALMMNYTSEPSSMFQQLSQAYMLRDKPGGKQRLARVLAGFAANALWSAMVKGVFKYGWLAGLVALKLVDDREEEKQAKKIRQEAFITAATSVLPGFGLGSLGQASADIVRGFGGQSLTDSSFGSQGSDVMFAIGDIVKRMASGEYVSKKADGVAEQILIDLLRTGESVVPFAGVPGYLLGNPRRMLEAK